MPWSSKEYEMTWIRCQIHCLSRKILLKNISRSQTSLNQSSTLKWAHCGPPILLSWYCIKSIPEHMLQYSRCTVIYIEVVLYYSKCYNAKGSKGYPRCWRYTLLADKCPAERLLESPYPVHNTIYNKTKSGLIERLIFSRIAMRELRINIEVTICPHNLPTIKVSIC